MWVKVHSGVLGNGEADRREEAEAWVGKRICQQAIATPGGIRQAVQVHHRPGKERRGWENQAIKRLTYRHGQRLYESLVVSHRQISGPVLRLRSHSERSTFDGMQAGRGWSG